MSVIVSVCGTKQMAFQSDARESDVPDPFTSNVFSHSAPSGLVQRASQEIVLSPNRPQSMALGVASESRISSLTKFRAAIRDGGSVSVPWEDSPLQPVARIARRRSTVALGI
jgi:hypothetical protein